MAFWDSVGDFFGGGDGFGFDDLAEVIGVVGGGLEARQGSKNALSMNDLISLFRLQNPNVTNPFYSNILNEETNTREMNWTPGMQNVFQSVMDRAGGQPDQYEMSPGLRELGNSQINYQRSRYGLDPQDFSYTPSGDGPGQTPGAGGDDSEQQPDYGQGHRPTPGGGDPGGAGGDPGDWHPGMGGPGGGSPGMGFGGGNRDWLNDYMMQGGGAGGGQGQWNSWNDAATDVFNNKSGFQWAGRILPGLGGSLVGQLPRIAQWYLQSGERKDDANAPGWTGENSQGIGWQSDEDNPGAPPGGSWGGGSQNPAFAPLFGSLFGSPWAGPLDKMPAHPGSIGG